MTTSSPPIAVAAVRPAPARPRGALAEIAAHRDLLFLLAARDVRIRYKETVMGFAWALLLPLLVLASGVVIQFALTRVSGAPLDATRIAGVLVKSVPWSFFATAVGFATASVLTSASLVAKVWFPREVLPLASVAAQSVDLAVAAVAMTAGLAALGVGGHAASFWAVPLVGLLLALTAGLGLLFACANVFFRDVKYLVQVFLTYGIFFTPVFFDASVLGPRVTPWFMLNPVAPILEGLRLAIVGGHDLLVPLRLADGTLAWTPAYLAWSVVAAVGSIVAGLVAFHRSQDLFAELL